MTMPEAPAPVEPESLPITEAETQTGLEFLDPEVAATVREELAKYAAAKNEFFKQFD